MEKSIAIVITVRNEGESIANLLNSIVIQTKKPNEVIFLDAASTDNTRKIISSYKTKIKSLKIIKAKKINRAAGRNKAIQKSKSDIIAITDAGCILKKDWLKKITHPITSGEADSVAGFYLTQEVTSSQIASAPFVAVMPDQIDPTIFLPSSRSVAFTKEAWEKAEKYPEQVSYCEDLVFAHHLKTKTNMVVQPRALVYWDHFKGMRKFFHQINNYASGDVEAWHIPHVKKISTVYARYLLFIAFPGLFFIYLLWPVYKHYKHTKAFAATLLLPIFQVITDMGILLGSSTSLIRRFARR